MVDEKIKNIIFLAAKYPIISRVGVFGSYARGEQTADSDLDIMFDYNKAGDGDTDFVLDILNYGGELQDELEKIDIDLDYVSYKGLMDSNDSRTRENILSDLRWVYENESGNNV